MLPGGSEHLSLCPEEHFLHSPTVHTGYCDHVTFPIVLLLGSDRSIFLVLHCLEFYFKLSLSVLLFYFVSNGRCFALMTVRE